MELLKVSAVKLGDENEFTKEELENEVWKDIPSYKGYYQVSDLGRVKSLVRKWSLKEKISKRQDNGKGYYLSSLSKDGCRKKVLIHQLVAMAFLNHNPCGHKVVVDHKDNVSTNNRIGNLQLITQRQNTIKDKVSKSGFTGVTFIERSKKWQSQIKINGKNFFLGSFFTKEEACLAYKKASTNLDGVKARPKASVYKGITFHKRKNKWQANTVIEGKYRYLGLHKTEIEAYNAIIEFKENLIKIS